MSSGGKLIERKSGRIFSISWAKILQSSVVVLKNNSVPFFFAFCLKRIVNPVTNKIIMFRPANNTDRRMIELFDRGNKFKLDVQSYEFPGSKDELDANWLVVGIEVDQNGGISWSERGPYLRTCELVGFLGWLKSLHGNVEASRIEFIEGELAFEYTDDMRLGVILDFNFHPKGQDYDYSSDHEFSLYFKITEKQRADLIRAVEQLIKEYPER